MFYPQVNENTNDRGMINAFYGYNHNYVISSGELYDMQNLTSDYFPVLTPRSIRPKLRAAKNMYRGFTYFDGDIAVVDGNKFYWDRWTDSVNLAPFLTHLWTEENGGSELELVQFGIYVLIFPDAVYVNMVNKEVGTMGAKYTTPGSPLDDDGNIVGAESRYYVKWELTDINGDAYSNVTVAETAPSSPSAGQYWLCSKEGEKGLYQWYTTTSEWKAVATTYIKMYMHGTDMPSPALTSKFNVGDTVFLNAPSEYLINDGSQIIAMDDDYIIVEGLMEELTHEEYTTNASKFYIERKIPDMEHVCINNNRVWGCHNGMKGNERINEIYACKLGDFKNWYTYQGLSTDSYAVSCGVNGAWTGAISYNNMPTFFKENAIYRIYGNYPAEYQVSQIDARGVQQGSSRSLVILEENLYYKAPGAVMVFDGSLPVSISENFGRDSYYYKGIAGAVDNKYHICMESQYGGHYYFIYDSEKGLWMKQDNLNVRYFSGSLNGQMYACTKDSIYGVGHADSSAYLNKLVSEEWVEWMAETGIFGLDIPDFKYLSRISIRAYIASTSEIRVEVSYDDGKYEELTVFRGSGDTISQTIGIMPIRCDHFRLRLSGHGDVRIYSLTTTMESESEEYGYKN